MHRGRAACLLVPSLAVALEPLGAVRWTGSMIYTYAQLREQHSRRKIDRWVAEERLVRAGRHLVLPGTDDAIIAALESHGGNRLHAAAALGMSRSTLYRKLRVYGILSV